MIFFAGGSPREILSSLGNGFVDKMEHIVRTTMIISSLLELLHIISLDAMHVSCQPRKQVPYLKTFKIHYYD